MSWGWAQGVGQSEMYFDIEGMRNRLKSSAEQTAGHNRLQTSHGKGDKKAKNAYRMEREYTGVSFQDQRDGGWKPGLTRAPGPISNTKLAKGLHCPCPQQPPMIRPTANGASLASSPVFAWRDGVRILVP